MLIALGNAKLQQLSLLSTKQTKSRAKRGEISHAQAESYPRASGRATCYLPLKCDKIVKTYFTDVDVL